MTRLWKKRHLNWDLYEREFQRLNACAEQKGEKRNKSLNKNRRDYEYNVGDWVLVETERRLKGEPIFEEPYQILKTASNGNALTLENQRKNMIRNIKKVNPLNLKEECDVIREFPPFSQILEYKNNFSSNPLGKRPSTIDKRIREGAIGKE
ncbi:hypothetical protein M153_7660003760 [Pseudoloma neurophilia]|uniref:Transposable element n=1 Tax=Pseudoloma neurophilia TaxID=146866 RepID=A0A0R0LW19_9MICR|nr:hypothetical protein M153_7660003760 [Pseudoloma neurophilia]